MGGRTRTVLTSKVMSMGGKEWFRLGSQGRQSMENLGIQGGSGGELRWLTLKGEGPIRGYDSRVRLTSPPHIDTGGVDVRIMSGDSLLDSREEGSRRKEGVCQEDNSVNGISFKMGCFLTPVRLLQVYFVLASWTSQVLYLRRAAFLQCLVLTRSI